ncbi:MAG: monofunctional biosynthetic peptidoglycan transglycosylase [Desulfotignum sp.]|nr:monofunctional biosynthetic peptidoglycan transglycosylase [Desulfotignum sp.]
MKPKTKKSLVRTVSQWLAKVLLKFVLVLISLTLLQVVALKYVNPPFTINMVWERLRHDWFDAPYVVHDYEWQDLSNISPHLQQAVLAGEDQRFFTHQGFDFQEIKVVLTQMMEGKPPRGASTITMQAARSVFLPATRNPVRKLGEAWYTVMMELIWDKHRILEIYLNTVDWGTGIVGAQAGARRYFETTTAELTRNQAAWMAAVLPSPHKWSPTDPTSSLEKRQQRILEDMTLMPFLNGHDFEPEDKREN